MSPEWHESHPQHLEDCNHGCKMRHMSWDRMTTHCSDESGLEELESWLTMQMLARGLHNDALGPNFEFEGMHGQCMCHKS